MAKRIVLDAKLDSAAAEPLRDTLLTMQGEDLAFDGSGVAQIGGLCLELMMCVRHLWVANGKTVSLENPSAQMLDDLGRFGLTEADFQGRPA